MPHVPMIKERFRRLELAAQGPQVWPFFEDFHLLRMQGNYEYPRHQHTNYEVILVDRGPYRCELNGEQLAINEGQVLVIKPGDWHQDHLRARQRHYVIHFRLVAALHVGLAPVLFRSQVRPTDQICAGDYSRETLFLRELRLESEQGERHASAVQDALLKALFWRIVRGLPAAVLSEEFRRLPQEELRQNKIAEVFQRNLAKNPTVQEMAAEARMSPRRFTTLCGQMFGEGPARFLLRLKLRRAEELLRYRGESVKAVSEALGFANPFHFSRVFKRILGFPPSHNARQNLRPS